MTMQKIGYAGTYLMELANTGDPAAVLEKAQRARASASSAPWQYCMIAYIEDIARTTARPVTLRGWLHNRRSSGKIHFLTVRDGSGFIQCVMSKQAVGEEAFTAADHLVAGERDRRPRHRARRRARQGGYEIDVTRPRDRVRARTTIRSRRRNTASTT